MLPSSLVPPLDNNDRLVELMDQVTGQSAARVRERLFQEEMSLGTNVAQEIQRRGIIPHHWSDDLIRFYQESDSFLYESVVWNRTAKKMDIRNWIGAYLNGAATQPRKILLYGDGPGFDSAFFAQAGFAVTYFEVSTLNRAFAAKVFSDLQSTVHMVRDPSELEPGSFDAVICLGVLEHLPAPEEATREFSRYLRPGGLLIVDAPFFLTAGQWVTHLRSNRKRYSGRINLYSQFGFVLEDGRFFWDPLVLVKTEGNGSLPRRSTWKKRLLVRLGGMMLWWACFWSYPFAWFAKRLTLPDPRWRQGLQP